MKKLRHLIIYAALLSSVFSQNVANAISQTAAELEASQTVLMVPISVGDIFIIIPVGTGLPPDPGEIGKFTIQGVDADADGVRDDVERNISMHYVNNPLARAYSYIVAMNYQAMIENSANKQTQLQSISQLIQMEDCLDKLLPDEAVKGSDLVLPWVLDTYQRSYAYIDARGLLGGEALPVVTGCP